MNNQENVNTVGTKLGDKIAAWGIVLMIFYLVFIDK
jgi:preprotein translocase subunit SecF